MVEDFYSSAMHRKTCAVQKTRFATFPRYLMVRLQRYIMGQDWTAKKLDVSVCMPVEIDIGSSGEIDLRGYGVQPGEELLPEETDDDLERMRAADNKSSASKAPSSQAPPNAAVEIDESIVTQLQEMGFPRHACRRAVYTTKSAGIEPASNWVMEHMGDAEIGRAHV